MEKAMNGAAFCAAEACCVFCLTGREQCVIRQIQQLDDHTALCPVVERHEFIRKREEAHFQVLFPGYVFIYTLGKLRRQEILRIPSVIRFLENGSEGPALRGEDARFASYLFEHGGIIGKSHAVREGDRIRVVEGPMKDLNGTITQVNKQRRRATVEFVFDGIPRSVTMAFDWVQAESREMEMAGV